jgi:tripartite-type tricarboxylate transporter receptor subunit TctC
MRRRDLLALGLATVSARAGVLRTASAQPKYPERPIRLMIPFPPGGGFDAIGRPWAEKIKPFLGTVVVENQGGGGSSIGAAVVAWLGGRGACGSPARLSSAFAKSR